MSNLLNAILEQKKTEIAHLKKIRSSFTGRTSGKRPFISALKKNDELAIITEVKKASPSKGIIRADFDPVKIATLYEKGGASAISVLTDEHFFMGSAQHLVDVRAAVSLPVLRKDFIIDPLQVAHTASINADAMLLIAAALSDGQMEELYHAAIEHGIDVLIEVHNGKELDRTMKLDPQLIGINNRDLSTFVSSLETTFSLMKHIPKEVTVVSESGISSATQATLLKKAGVNALLVGESLMKLDNPQTLINELAHACKD